MSRTARNSLSLGLRFVIAAVVWVCVSVGVGYIVGEILASDFSTTILISAGAMLGVSGALSELIFLLYELRNGTTSWPRWILVSISAVVAPSVALAVLALITGDFKAGMSGLALGMLLLVPAGPIGYLASLSYKFRANPVVETDAPNAARPSL